MTVIQSLFVSLALNGTFFILAAILRTDVFTDITYSLSFIALSTLLVVVSGNHGLVAVLSALAVIVWALRLGSYLFVRILTIKVDHRFDDKRSNPVRFGIFWLLQALTVWIVMLPVYGLFSVDGARTPPVFAVVAGALLFAAGLALEAVADAQKFAFKTKPENRGKFMRDGIWKYSRHPNYLGEMLVWWGLSLPGIFLFRGVELFFLAGAPFITLMLLFVSGIPLLEKSAEEKWGSDPEYRAYRDSTPVLVPFAKRRGRKNGGQA